MHYRSYIVGGRKRMKALILQGKKDIRYETVPDPQIEQPRDATTAGLFGYTHLTGGYPGGQAEYVRVPFADRTHVKIPAGLSDEQVLFLGDIFPTGWQAAVQCDIEPSDNVAIWGAGPVGQMAIRSAILLGARQVIAIDRVPERLAMARAGGATTIDFDQESVRERLSDLTQGKGPEKCIDAVGMESHATRSTASVITQHTCAERVRVFSRFEVRPDE